jgi:hypothetical protein
VGSGTACRWLLRPTAASCLRDAAAASPPDPPSDLTCVDRREQVPRSAAGRERQGLHLLNDACRLSPQAPPPEMQRSKLTWDLPLARLRPPPEVQQSSDIGSRLAGPAGRPAESLRSGSSKTEPDGASRASSRPEQKAQHRSIPLSSSPAIARPAAQIARAPCHSPLLFSPSAAACAPS